MGIKADTAGTYEETCKYLEAAAANFSLDAQSPTLKTDLGNIYLLLASSATRANKQDDVLKYLKRAESAKTPVMETYLWLYDIYKEVEDTLNCGKVIKTAEANANRADSAGFTHLEGYRLDYYAMIKDSTNFLATADALIAAFPKEPGILSMVAGHLLNNNYYDKAETILRQGLELSPNHFDLNRQLGLRYFFEADDNLKLESQVITKGNYADAKRYKDKAIQLLETAYPFVEKAYSINGNDRQNNIMLNQIMTTIGKPIPAELKEKIDLYYKK
ncbi:MAG: hypothetical protein LBV46_04320 [Bacteroidales bacterium]|jgi:tetratricopeptide (TPR) repeat protein|nr:hypothetical protein [Bacteroidales bacterium]